MREILGCLLSPSTSALQALELFEADLCGAVTVVAFEVDFTPVTRLIMLLGFTIKKDDLCVREKCSEYVEEIQFIPLDVAD